MRDISARLRAMLPQPLLEKVQESETVLNQKIAFFEDTAMRGGAGGSASPDGVIKLAPRAVENMSVIGEEIMHLHRWTSGFPAIRPERFAQMFHYSQGLLQIGGHFDEHAFFPFLEGIGLNPRSEVLPTLEPEMKRLEELLPDIERQGETAQWRVVLSAKFVQAQLIAPASGARDAMIGLFQKPELQPYAVSGQAVSEEIVAAACEVPAQVEQRMQRTLREWLRLNEEGASIRRFY